MAPSRRFDIDDVRIIGMIAVFTFHIMMYFNTWPWHAKSAVTTAAFEPINQLLLAWIMPLFFLISGFATYHALARRTAMEVAKERLLRLGFALRDLSLPLALQFPLFWLASFSVIMGLYHVVVRRVPCSGFSWA